MALRSNEYETGGSDYCKALFTIHALNLALLFCPQGFDEFMNVVMDDSEEVFVKTDARKQIGGLCQQCVCKI